MSLTAKQEAFCQEYIVDKNGAAAAVRSGYSDKTAKEQASRLLTNVNVKARIDELLEEQSKRCQIDADYVLNGIKELNDICMGKTAIPMKIDGEEHMVTVFEHTGASKTYELMGKHFKMFTDKIDVDANVNVMSEILEDLDETDGLPTAED